VRNRGRSPFPSLHRVEPSSTTQGSVQSVADGDRFAFPQAKSDPGKNFRQFRENVRVKKSLPFTYSVEFDRRARKKKQMVSEIDLGRDKHSLQTKSRATDRTHKPNHWKLRTTNKRAHPLRASADQTLGRRRGSSSNDDDHRDEEMWPITIATIAFAIKGIVSEGQKSGIIGRISSPVCGQS
jgi:hypothetical protein